MLDCLDLTESSFVHHMNNACYKTKLLNQFRNQMNQIIKQLSVAMKVGKFSSLIVKDRGAFITKILIFFVHKDEKTWKNKHAKAVNTIYPNINIIFYQRQWLRALLALLILKTLSFHIIISEFLIQVVPKLKQERGGKN